MNPRGPASAFASAREVPQDPEKSPGKVFTSVNDPRAHEPSRGRPRVSSHVCARTHEIFPEYMHVPSRGSNPKPNNNRILKQRYNDLSGGSAIQDTNLVAKLKNC